MTTPPMADNEETNVSAPTHPAMREAIEHGTAALLRDRLGYLAPSANDEAIAQARHDTEVVLAALLLEALVSLPRA